MPPPTSQPEPPYVTCRRFLVGGVVPGAATLDVGCGTGDLMVELAGLGAEVRGVEVVPALVEACRGRGLDVVAGAAEQLPFAAATFDRIVCSVVVPYTDERRAVAEWGRVLRPGGRAYATYHGVGYGLDYGLRGPGLKKRIYGARMLLNTACYRAGGRRLPGGFGDTLCQTTGRLRAYYARAGLVLEAEVRAGSVLGAPRFLCHRLVKPPGGASAAP